MNLNKHNFGKIFAAAWYKSVTVDIGKICFRSCEIILTNPDVILDHIFVPFLGFGAKQDGVTKLSLVMKSSEEPTTSHLAMVPSKNL
jgi:hypothetical protein